MGLTTGLDSSAEPVRNWQEEWHDEKAIGGDQFDLRHWVKRYWGDYGCAITCLKLAVIKSGVYKGAITDNPDYEMTAYLGPNLGIFDTAGIVHLSSVIEELGYSGINGGNLLAFATELYQRGILTRDDLKDYVASQAARGYAYPWRPFDTQKRNNVVIHALEEMEQGMGNVERGEAGTGKSSHPQPLMSQGDHGVEGGILG
jgi:aldehyde:ferredoxin oxidoreductase